MTSETGDKNETLIFVHMPKTAGVTFRSILTNLYPTGTISVYSYDGVRDLINLSEEARAETNLLQGHFSYGVHGYLSRPAKYITFLRDPIDRVVSLYYFARKTHDVYFHKTLVENNISLAEFAEGGVTPQTANYQTKALAGLVQPSQEIYPPIDETILPLAKQRLAANFAAFGLTERFDESLLLLSRALKWPLLGGKMFYQRQNVTVGRKPLAEISPEAIATIRRHNALDIQLYEYACELFHARVKAALGIQVQLWMYRKLNQRASAKPKTKAG